MSTDDREVAVSDTLGANLRILRAYHQLTLEEVAERSSLHPDTVSDYERGRGNPRVRTLTRLAVSYGVSNALLVTPFELPELPTEEERS